MYKIYKYLFIRDYNSPVIRVASVVAAVGSVGAVMTPIASASVSAA